MNKILHEPLLHFSLLALLVFGLNAFFGKNEHEVIHVDMATQNYLVTQEEEILMRPLLEKEKAQLIQSFIEDEILVREAKKRGFTDNSRIRALLLQNMRFLLQDRLQPPTEKELREFFTNNPNLFESPEQISFDQVYFQDPTSIPKKTLHALQNGAAFQKLGDHIPLGPTLTVITTKRNISMNFPPNEAKEIWHINDKQWHGPFISKVGGHFLRLRERQPPSLPKFEEIQEWVTVQWQTEHHKRNLERQLEEMKKDYTIEIEAQQEH